MVAVIHPFQCFMKNQQRRGYADRDTANQPRRVSGYNVVASTSHQEQRRLRQTTDGKSPSTLNVDLRLTYLERRVGSPPTKAYRKLEKVHREAQFGEPFILAHIRATRRDERGDWND